MTEIHLYQIAYSKETLEQIEPGYKVLDNLDNLRPDWYEYWPIRNFLLNNNLSDNDYFGFFSPKFKKKTNLSYSDVYRFIDSNKDQTDIFLFSPQFDMGAFFINVFEQGEAFDVGFIKTFKNFLNEINLENTIESQVMDSNEIVFSNYFVAKFNFWKEWLAITEKLFALCEDKSRIVDNDFCYETSYPGKAQRKIFIIERIASYLIKNRKKWKVKSGNSINMCWSALPTNQFVNEAIISDALKISYNKTRKIEYLNIYFDIRKKIFNSHLKLDR